MKIFDECNNYFLRCAAIDVPSFYPTWVGEHPDIKSIPELKKLEKKIPIENFREEIPGNILSMKTRLVGYNGEYNYNVFKNQLIQLLKKSVELINSSENIEIKNAFINYCDLLSSEISKSKEIISRILTTGKVSEGLKLTKDIKINFPTSTLKGVFSKTLFVPSGTTFGKAFRILHESCNKYLKINLPEDLLEIIPKEETGDFSKDKYFMLNRLVDFDQNRFDKKNYVVFSKNPLDILRMSISSDWTSCMNLMIDEVSKYDNKNKAVYSAISPYLGILYLTNELDYKGRGEEMIARCLVLYLQNNLTNKDAICLSNFYGDIDNNYVVKVFTNVIKQYTTLPIVDINQAVSQGYFFPSANDKIPYIDSKELKVLSPREDGVIDEDW